MFDIFFEGKGSFRGETGYDGKIIIGNYSEKFFSNNSFFNENDYRRSWYKSSKILLTTNKSYFLVQVYNPKLANFFLYWPCYLCDNLVLFQNGYLFSDQYCLEKVLSFQVDIGELELTDDDGDKISTWQTDIESMLAFNRKMHCLFS